MENAVVAPGGVEVPRRFNVGDALILVAALGLGLSSIRDRIRTVVPRAHAWSQDYHRYENDLAIVPPIDAAELDFARKSLFVQISDEGRAWFLSVLTGLTPAQILLRLRRPRPAWRSLVHQLGFIACLAAVAGYLLDRGWDHAVRLGFAPFPFWTSLSVLAAWAIMFLSQRGHAEKGWIDRLGRVLGTAWVVAGFWFQLEQFYLW
jgi:hypothetical protein